jgi:hypothetical protein
MNKDPDILNLAATTITTALALAILIAISAGRVYLWDLAAVVAVTAPAVLAGRVAGLILGIPRRPGFIFAFEIVVGFAALSLLDLGWAVLLRLDALPAIIFSTVTVGVLFTWKGRLPAGVNGLSSGSSWADLVILPVIAGLVAIWDHSTLTCLRDAERSGTFLGWPDLMIHATQINYLLHYHVFVGQSLELAGTPQYFYHRGSYAVAAAFAALTDRGSLEVATCLWQPLGLILLGLGAYGYASALGRRTAGIFAVFALFLVPDAAMYGLRNDYFSFHWLVVVSPATGYGIAVIFIALATFAFGLSVGRSYLVFVGAIFALMAFAFKVQVAVPAGLLYAILSFFVWRPTRSWQRPFALLAVSGAAGAAVVILERVKLAPHFLSGTYDALRFLGFAHTQKSLYSEFYLKWIAGSGMIVTGLAGVSLLLAAAFGLLLPVSIAVAVFHLRKGADWRIEFIPLGLLAAYLAIIFLMPDTAYGNFSEYSHRPFVLVYAVMLVATVAGLSAIAEEIVLASQIMKPALVLMLSCLALGGLFSAWPAGQHIQLSWGDLTGMPMPRSLIEACRFIRANSEVDDRVLSSDGDPMVIVAALSERPSFLSRGRFFHSFKGSTGDVADSRGRLLVELQSAKGFEALRDFGRAHEIRWFLLCQGDLPKAGPDLLNKSIWSSEKLSVFDLK